MDLLDLEYGLDKAYTQKVLAQFYRTYWKSLAPNHVKLSKYILPGKKIPRKSSLLQMFVIILDDDLLRARFFQCLPKVVHPLIESTVWEGGVHLKNFEETHGVIVSKGADHHYWSTEENLLPEFWLFGVWNPNPYAYDYQLYDHLYLPDILRHFLKQHLKKPANYHIRPVKKLPQNLARHREENIFQILEIGRFFIDGDHLKYNTAGTKILVSSLRRFAEQAKIREFFGPGDKNLKLVKTQLILNILGELYEQNAPPEPLSFLKHLMVQILEKQKLSFVPVLLTHLKGRNYLLNFPHWEDRELPALVLKRVFDKMPLNEWVSMTNIWDFIRYRDLDLQFGEYVRAMQNLYFSVQTGQYYRQKIELDLGNIDHFLTQPLLKGIMFMLSALGLLEIAYDLPKNPALLTGEDTYISIYDGLDHVKLTRLGAYILGKSDGYDGPVDTASRGEIAVDDKALILTLKGDDPMKTITLEQMATPIGANRFKVDFASFLKPCRSRKDVKEQIGLFRKEICKQPPAHWETFFETALKRVGPLKRTPFWEVYEVNPNPELVHLLATDPLLKSHVLKAEGYRVLIKPGHRKKVMRRLEEFGFLITD